MSHVWRISRSTRLLILPVVVVMSVGAIALDLRDVPEQQQVARWIPFSQESIEQYRRALPDLLSLPCDSIPAPLGNEISDCQRLVMREGEFGSLIGIFPRLEVIRQPEAAFSTPQMVAYITNAGGSIEPNEQYTDYGYPPLNIMTKSPGSTIPGQSCLWLHMPMRGDWRAAIVPNQEHNLQASELGCSTPPTEEEDWQRLRVTPQTYRNSTSDAYPETARWMWTAPGVFDGEHYITVKCGEAQQCAITFVNTTPPPINETEGDRRVAIAGWHDAQFLAVSGPANPATGPGSATLVPGPWAEIRPLMPPARHTTSAQGFDWQPVAEYRVHAAPREYEERLNLGRAGGSWTSVVSIRVEPDGTPEARYRRPGKFWDFLPGISPFSDPVVVRVSSNMHGPHGGARWRWRPEDESGWVPCWEYGCCDPEWGG
jgi:hypothetical protein